MACHGGRGGGRSGEGGVLTGVGPKNHPRNSPMLLASPLCRYIVPRFHDPITFPSPTPFLCHAQAKGQHCVLGSRTWGSTTNPFSGDRFFRGTRAASGVRGAGVSGPGPTLPNGDQQWTTGNEGCDGRHNLGLGEIPAQPVAPSWCQAFGRGHCARKSDRPTRPEHHSSVERWGDTEGTWEWGSLCYPSLGSDNQPCQPLLSAPHSPPTNVQLPEMASPPHVSPRPGVVNCTWARRTSGHRSRPGIRLRIPRTKLGAAQGTGGGGGGRASFKGRGDPRGMGGWVLTLHPPTPQALSFRRRQRRRRKLLNGPAPKAPKIGDNFFVGRKIHKTFPQILGGGGSQSQWC